MEQKRFESSPAAKPDGQHPEKPTFDQLIDQWRQPIEVPSDNHFYQKVESKLSGSSASKQIRFEPVWASIAAMLLISAGIGLGIILHNIYTYSDSPAIASAAYELDISDYETNPYEYLIQPDSQ